MVLYIPRREKGKSGWEVAGVNVWAYPRVTYGDGIESSIPSLNGKTFAIFGPSQSRLNGLTDGTWKAPKPGGNDRSVDWDMLYCILCRGKKQNSRQADCE